MLHTIGTSNVALASRYDEIPYDALPHRATHPARLASVAMFVGHVIPHLERCSVLEVGCNDGSNLIPMAVSLPGARFVGCDLSPRAIEEGRRTIAALGLTNITLVEDDLAALAPEHGEFDSAWELTSAAATGGVHKLARRLDPAAGGGGPVRKLFEALIANQPASHAIASLDGHVDLRSLPRPLEAVLADAYSWGIVDLHVQPPALTIRPSDRPVASPLARLQARQRDVVTTLLHLPFSIADTNALRLLPLVDGTRDRAALASAVRQFATNIEPSRAGDFVNYALEKFARLGLLMAETPAA